MLEIISTKESYLEQGTSYQTAAKVLPSMVNLEVFCVKPKVSSKDKVYPKTYYHNSHDDIQVDETLTKTQIQNLQIVGWTLIEKQLVKLKLGI